MNADESSSNVDNLSEIMEEDNVSLLSEKENELITESSTTIQHLVQDMEADDIIENDILNLDEENKEPSPPPIFIMEVNNILKILITFYKQTETVFSNDK
ncbi:1481_t:CDS:2, partial [Ambispora leptoticha]